MDQPDACPASLQRLRSSAQFQAVLQGATVGRTPHFALHVLRWQPRQEGAAASSLLFADAHRHAGVLVPKRWARRAVTRNTIKRQMREAVRAHLPELPECCALVLRLRSGYDRKVYVSATSDALKRAVRAELGQLFLQARSRWASLPSPSRPAPAPRRRPSAAPATAGEQGAPSGTMRSAS